MDTSPASHSISLPQVSSLGPQPTATTMASLSPSASPNHHQQQQHHHHHNLSHSRSCCADMDHTQHHSNNNTHPHNNNININNKSKSTTRMSRSFSHSRAYGLSLREQQQIRNQQMNLNNNNSSTNNNNPLSLNIIPPKFMTNFYPIDESSCPSSSSMDSSFSQFNGSNSNNINDHQQSGSNNSFLGTSSQDSLGSSLSRHGSTGNTPRRASFNLSTGSLRNFNSGASPSLASPSSPSYSTIAVARARAAAAATAAASAGATGEGGSGSSQGAGRDGLGIVGSGVFPGGGALGQNSFSSAPSSSSSTSSFVPPSSDLYLNSKQPSNSYESNGGVPQPNSLGSSASSLTSNDSVLNGGMATATAGSSTSPLPASSLPTSQSHHLQDNANAEREISMILDNFLYLGGDLVDEEQIDELERLGIKRVLNMAINCDDLLWIKRAGKDNGSYLKVGLLDHVDQDLKAGLDIATKFIGSSSSPVYVHCQAGKSRSVATVIGYLIQEHKWPLKKAYDHVVERRRIMSPNIGFVSQLIMLEERVLGPEKAGGLVSTANSDEELDPASRTTVVPWMNS